MEELTTRTVTTYENVDQILRDLSDAWNKQQLPVDAIKAARERRDEMVPQLIDVIRKEAARPLDDELWARSSAPFFAFYLLAEFQAKEALPAIIEAVSLPGEACFVLFGEAITGDLCRVLATFAGDTPELIECLISDPSLNIYVRWDAGEALRRLAQDGRMAHEDAVRRLNAKLEEAIERKDGPIATALVSTLTDLGPREAMPAIRKAFELDLIELGLIDLEDVEEASERGELAQRPTQEPPTAIVDIIEELAEWAAFSKEEYDAIDIDPMADFSDLVANEFSPLLDAGDSSYPGETIRYEGQRIGRNDPCPCGSGRKFKKCCGKGGAD